MLDTDASAPLNTVKTITSRQHAFVTRCRAAARGDHEGEMLLDGVHLVAEALAAGVTVTAAAVTLAARQDPEVAALWQRLSAATTLFTASEAVMEAASPVRAPTGITALAVPPATDPDLVYAASPALVIGVAGVQDPGNVGAIIRSAEAAGATGAALTAGCANPFGWKALRGAMGSAFRLPIDNRGARPGDLVRVARSRGLQCLAADARGDADLYATDLTGPCLVLLGGEGAGLPDDVLALADRCVRIPMAPRVESLNVAVAAGVILFEAGRQRRVAGVWTT